MAKALIFGISGQDGSYLSEYLISLGYDVHGTIRRNSTPEHQVTRIEDLPVHTYYADLLDPESINRVVRQVKPDIVFNLAAQSHVRISSDMDEFTIHVNAIGVLRVLTAVKNYCPEAKFYQASSSEMFGTSVDPDGYQRETTPMHPVSPYGCSKVLGYNITNHFRSHGIKTYNGILFNHESPRRASNFVTNKIIKAAVRISHGKQDVLELGNLDSYRDWGHSKDYVRAMYLITQQEPCNMVVATGETRSVRDLCQHVFSRLGMDYRDHVVINPKFFRPEELPYLKGDSTNIRNLGWKPEYTFESMVDEMIDAWKR